MQYKVGKDDAIQNLIQGVNHRFKVPEDAENDLENTAESLQSPVKERPIHTAARMWLKNSLNPSV
jgi:hypothetical protein